MKLYHLSFNSELAGILKPRQPGGGEFTDDGIYTENLPPRVSFSPTIEQCFYAIYPNISHLLERKKANNEKWIYMSVYSPLERKLNLIPEKVVRANVWDAHITGEVCVLDPVEVIKVGEVRFDNPYYRGNVPEYIFTHAFNDPKLEELFVTPKVTYMVTKTSKRLGKEHFAIVPKSLDW